MLFHAISLVLLSCLAFAAPTPTPTVEDADLEKRDLISSVVGSVIQDLGSLSSSGNVVNNLLTDLKLIQKGPTPANVDVAASSLQDTCQASPSPSSIFAYSGALVAAGLTTYDINDAVSVVDGVLTGQDSDLNINPWNPSPRAFPRAAWNDAPYSLTEAQLRAAIYIPPGFQFGRRGAPQPVILVPGSGNTGFTTFVGNYIPLLSGSSIADPVWLNIPGFLLNDEQVNAEYVAYAINYIYGISNKRNVALVSWSQGGPLVQWATKYWPSTRSRVTDHVAHSADYKGTIIANFAATPGEPLPPSILQQEATSNFVRTLLSRGGDSAYVPTTNVYSGFFDEIVEPQQGPIASAYQLDARRVGVSNTQVQLVCPGQAASSFYTHEGVLYNPIAFALFKDALANKGPGQLSRLNLREVCAQYLTPGLGLTDFLLTENTIPIAAVAIVAREPTSSNIEPPIKGESN